MGNFALTSWSPLAPGASPKIAFLGDSITWGSQPLQYPWDGSSYVWAGGYRQYVYSRLVAVGRTPTMYGIYHDTAQGNPDSLAGGWHSGVGGSQASDWQGLSLTDGGVGQAIAAQGTPNVVTLMLGANMLNTTNDGVQIGLVIDRINICWPLAAVFVCSRTPNSSNASNAINAQIAVECANRANKHVQFVDIFAAFQSWQAQYIPDGLHPGAVGYSRIGDMFSTAILGLLR